MDLSKLNNGGSLPVGSQLKLVDNLPTVIDTGYEVWLRSGYIEDDPANFDDEYWDYTRGTWWDGAQEYNGRANMVAAANGNTVILGVTATSAPASGGVAVSSDGGITFGAIIVPPNYTTSEGVTAVKWVQALGLWIIGSSLGKIHTSPDGVNWTDRSSPTANAIRHIEFANAVLVLVGASGTIVTSANGTSYTLRTSNVSGENFTSVAFYGGVWLAVSNTAASKGSRSTDNGVTWAAVTVTPAGFSSTVNVIATDIGFVVSTTQYGLYKSTTGATGSWTYIGHRSLSLTKLSFNGEFYMFASASNIYKSYDLVEMRRYAPTSGAIQTVNIHEGFFLFTATSGTSDCRLWIGNKNPFAGNPVGMIDGNAAYWVRIR